MMKDNLWTELHPFSQCFFHIGTVEGRYWKPYAMEPRLPLGGMFRTRNRQTSRPVLNQLRYGAHQTN